MKNLNVKLAAFLIVFIYSISISQTTPSYQYDNLNRLIQVTHADGSIIAYQYDAVGNRTRKIITTEVTLPVVETASATEITSTAATVGGNVISSGGATVNERGVYWGTSPNPETTGTKLQIGSGIGSFSTMLSGLAPETPYYVKAYATNSEGTAYGQEQQFTTLPEILPITYHLQLMVSPLNAGIAEGEAHYEEGSQIPLSAIPNDGYEFINWTDEDSIEISNFANFVYTMPAEDVTLTANFVEEQVGFNCGDPLIDARDGQTYATVLIGAQCWMAENLNIGTRINGNSNQTNNGTIEKYCYNNSELNCDVYGGIYQWNEMMGYTTTAGVQGICPEGWHLPTDAEWCTLEQQVDPTITCSSIDWRGVDGGGKLKETGTTHWNSPNTGATNSSGFTALPGGVRYSNGSFYDVGSLGRWWSSTEYSASIAWYRALDYSFAQVLRSNYLPKSTGFSVRCLKDDSTSAELPTITTEAFTEVSATTATSGGNVTEDGGAAVTARGVCWSTSPNPTIDDNITTDGSGTGEFTSYITGLTPASTYYVRAYATNSVGTGYGEELSFTTEEPSTISINEIALFEVNTGISYVLDPPASLDVLARYGGGIRMDEQGNVHLAYGNYNTIRHAICNTDYSIISTVVDTVEKKVVRPGLARNENGYYIVTEEWNRTQTYNSYTDNRLYFQPFNGSWNKLQDIQLNVYHEAGGAKDLAYTIKEAPDGNLHILYERTGWWSYGFAQKERVLDKNTHIIGDLSTISWRYANHPDVARNFAFAGNFYLSNDNSLIAPLRDHQSNYIFLNKALPESFSEWTDVGNTTSFGSNVNQWQGWGMWQDDAGNVHSTIIIGADRKLFYSLNWQPFEEISAMPASGADIAVFNGYVYVLFSHSDPEHNNEQGNLFLTSKPLDGNEWSAPQQVTFETNYFNDWLIRNFYFARPFGYRQNAERLCFAYTVFDGYWSGNDYLSAHLKLMEINQTSGLTVTLHPGDHGSIAEANAGANFIATLNYGDPFPTVTITPDSGYIFTGWDPQAPAFITADFTATAQYQLIGSFTCGDLLLDQRDDQTYATVQIGTQCWMAENLNIGTMINGNQNMTNNGMIEKYCYNNSEANCDVYGGLYQWDEMMDYTTTPGVQGICPEGWRIPSDAEWKILEGTVDNQYPVGDPEWDDTGWRGLDAGGNLKEAGTTHWNSPNTGATNSSGYTALSGGYRHTNGSFLEKAYYNFWWSSSENDASTAWPRGLFYGGTQVDRGIGNRSSGFSVRCLKDDSTSAELPTITTEAITEVASTTATSGGNVTYDGGAAITARGVCWSTSLNPTIDDNFTMDGSGTGEYTSYITGLAPATTYYVRAYATNSVGTGFGEELSFTTDEAGAFSCGDLLIDPRDGNTYTTVLIGEQCWMSENLAYLPEVNSPNQGSVTEPRYYVHGYSGNSVAEAKATTSYQIFGALYNWTASLQVCPTDWHLPFADEWMQLIGYIEAQGFPNIDLPNSAGNALKSCRQVNSPLGADCSTLEHPRWNENNTHYGFDEFGFSAFPGSNRSSSGLFGSFGPVGQWWSATAGPNISARRFYLIASGGRLNYDNVPRETGFSIRCLRDESAQVNLPSVTTFSILDLTESTATSGGNVIGDGGAEVTARGVCWSASPNPTIDDNFTMDGNGTGEFTSYITGLTPATTYYVRAYATNSAGTGYGEELSFTTLNEVFLPTVLTQPVAEISEISATSGGSVIDDGGAEVTDRGIVWNTSGDPSLEINEGLTQDGAGMGDFISYLTGLSAGTTYYVRAYATNSEGTAYGNEVSFTTLSSETYFNTVWTTPFNPMTFYILAANIDDLPMQAGSEIGLLDIDPITGQEICVGAGVLVEPLGGVVYLEMIASMNDGSNPDQANGFTPGNSIIYRLWNETTGEISTVTANYPYPGYDEVYTSQGAAMVELNGATSITQELALQTGWNLISFRVMPENWNMLHIVQPLIDQEILFKVLDEAGGSIFHLPFPPPNGQWSNTIGNMANTEGYYVKVTGDGTLSLEGFPVETPMDIPLTNGWNIMSYPCENPQNALDAVQSLINAGVLFKVIDESGGSIFHLPFPPPNGQWTNTIGNFQSGKGYYLRVTAATTLTITEPSRAADPLPETDNTNETIFFQPVWENNPYMPMHIVIQPDEHLQAGDEIGVFDGEICVGAATFDGDYAEPIIIITSMDDPYTLYVDGFQPGNNIELMVWDHITSEAIFVDYEPLSGSSVFEPLGTLVAELRWVFTGINVILANELNLTVMPNPFDEEIQVGILLPESGMVKIAWLNLLGVKVADGFEQQMKQGSHSISFTMPELIKGVYLLQVTYVSKTFDQTTISRKIIKK